MPVTFLRLLAACLKGSLISESYCIIIEQLTGLSLLPRPAINTLRMDMYDPKNNHTEVIQYRIDIGHKGG